MIGTKAGNQFGLTSSSMMQPPSFFTSTCGCMISWVLLHSLLLLQIMIMFHGNHVICGNIVKSLPGFEGELPFKLETGYVSVEGSELFYYFVESEGDPKKDPFVLWFSGGPGCSAFNGLIYEIGPLAFNNDDYEGGLPNLRYVEYSWTKTASVLFVDSPVGVGFSYATEPSNYYTSDTKWAAQNYIFLKKWLLKHPKYLKLQLFVGADSYAGLIVPLIVKAILDGNKARENPHLNLKGYIEGCPATDQGLKNAVVTFSHRIGLISDELYEAATEACEGNYYFQKDLSNAKCIELVKEIDSLTKYIDANHVLDPKCAFSSPNDQGGYQPVDRRRSLCETPRKFLSTTKIPDLWCRNFNYVLSYIWENDPRVQGALHVREGTKPPWERCNETLSFTYDVSTVLAYHKNFTKTDLYALVYNGDHDFTVPNVVTQLWIKKLNLTVDEAWRPWFVDGEVAGYVEKYKQVWFRLTYATIKGAGHIPQVYKRWESYEMFRRWIHWYPV